MLVSSKLLQKGCLCLHGATLLQMFQKVIKQPLPTVPEGNQCLLANDQRILAGLEQICAICEELPIPLGSCQ